MDFKKVTLYAALIVVGLMLWNAWQREFPPQLPANVPAQVAVPTTTGSSNVPTVLTQNTTASTPNAPSNVFGQHGQLITVNTGVLNVTIDTLGGNVVQSALTQYPQSANTPNQSVQLFNIQNNTYYVAQSGLTGTQGPDTPKGQVQYRADQSSYTLSPNQNQLTVNLTWQGNGLSVVKSYTFTRGSYDIGMQYTINNHAATAWTGYLYTQLARKPPAAESASLAHYATFVGAAVSSPAEHYQKLKFDSFTEEPLSQDAQGGWAAMIQQYFLSAWVPNANETYHYYTSANNDGVYTIGMISGALTIAPGEQATKTAQLYVGPAIASNLDQVSPYLSMTIDYGWLWFISQIIFWMMKHIFDVVGNWGWSIILVTLVIKAIFYPLSNKSFHSMAKMRILQPRIAQLKERLGDDRQVMSKAMMDLYREEKVNPLGGCLPMLVQIPVFIALYWVIIQSVELRQAPWLGWVTDLAVHDSYYILPVIMGLLMFLQQKLSPPPPDPTQAKVMMFMPVIFTVLFLNFPSGLVLYWVTNTLVTVIHQYIITVKYEREEKMKKAGHKQVKK